MKQALSQERGFTLIEIMTALAIFAIVMTISMGAILGIFDANRRSRALKDDMNNLNLAVEEMTKEMRYGKNYHCGTSGTETLPQNCFFGDAFLSFLSSDNVQVAYRFNGTALERRENGGAFIPVTAPEVLLDNYSFFVSGVDTGDGYQPKIFLYIKGHSGPSRSRTDFFLQTLISQRSLDS